MRILDFLAFLSLYGRLREGEKERVKVPTIPWKKRGGEGREGGASSQEDHNLGLEEEQEQDEDEDMTWCVSPWLTTTTMFPVTVLQERMLPSIRVTARMATSLHTTTARVLGSHRGVNTYKLVLALTPGSSDNYGWRHDWRYNVQHIQHIKSGSSRPLSVMLIFYNWEVILTLVSYMWCNPAPASQPCPAFPLLLGTKEVSGDRTTIWEVMWNLWCYSIASTSWFARLWPQATSPRMKGP